MVWMDAYMDPCVVVDGYIGTINCECARMDPCGWLVNLSYQTPPYWIQGRVYRAMPAAWIHAVDMDPCGSGGFITLQFSIMGAYRIGLYSS